jgi:hypothetical protein
MPTKLLLCLLTTLMLSCQKRESTISGNRGRVWILNNIHQNRFQGIIFFSDSTAVPVEFSIGDKKMRAINLVLIDGNLPNNFVKTYSMKTHLDKDSLITILTYTLGKQIDQYNISAEKFYGFFVDTLHYEWDITSTDTLSIPRSYWEKKLRL